MRRPTLRGRGRPVWQPLVVLTLLPLVAAAVMGGISVASADQAARRALEAQRLVRSVELLDSARRATDAEVLPTMLVGLLRDPDRAAAVGFPADRRAVLRVTEPAVIQEARQQTDAALKAVLAPSPVPQLRAAVVSAQDALMKARAAADQGHVPLQTFISGFGQATTGLAGAQRWASARAVASGLGTQSVAALQDLNQVVLLSNVASLQLAVLFSARVLPPAATDPAQRAWIAAWGTYTALVDDVQGISTEPVQAAWKVFRANAAVTAFSDLLTRQALNPDEPVLQTGALPGLVDRSNKRDEAIAVILQDAVAEVARSASVDRDHATAREHTALIICLALVLLSLLTAALMGHWLTSSIRSLASGARQVSLGHLVDVQPRGPRELRTAAVALSAAVAGLRRVREQAQAVVAGDPEAALRQERLPGPLGEVVHASVEQIVEAFRAREELQDELAR